MNDSRNSVKIALVLGRFPDYPEPPLWMEDCRQRLMNLQSCLQILYNNRLKLDLEFSQPVDLALSSTYSDPREAVEEALREAILSIPDARFACVFFNKPGKMGSTEWRDLPEEALGPGSPSMATAYLELAAPFSRLAKHFITAYEAMQITSQIKTSPLIV